MSGESLCNLVYAEKDGHVVHVSEVPSGLRCGCTCPECQEPLIARKGKIRAQHFAHRSGSTSCGATAPETALHKLAKELFKTAPSMILPPLEAWVEGNRYVVRGSTVVEIGSVAVEDSRDSVKPDAVVSDRYGQEYFVEVFVTHAVDEEKREKLAAMGTPTVEIDLSDVARDVSRDDLSLAIFGSCDRWSWSYHPDEAPFVTRKKAEMEELRRLEAERRAEQARREAEARAEEERQRIERERIEAQERAERERKAEQERLERRHREEEERKAYLARMEMLQAQYDRFSARMAEARDASVSQVWQASGILDDGVMDPDGIDGLRESAMASVKARSEAILSTFDIEWTAWYREMVSSLVDREAEAAKKSISELWRAEKRRRWEQVCSSGDWRLWLDANSIDIMRLADPADAVLGYTMQEILASIQEEKDRAGRLAKQAEERRKEEEAFQAAWSAMSPLERLLCRPACLRCGRPLKEVRMEPEGDSVWVCSNDHCGLSWSVDPDKATFVETYRRCPDCGKRMVLRTNHAKGTKFWGCQGYPTCKRGYSYRPGEKSC